MSYIAHMKQEDIIKHWSERLLECLLERRKQQPGFTFALRQVNRQGRLEAGHWFQGNESYIFVGFTARLDHDHKTRSLGFVLHELDEKGAQCQVELIFRNETNPDLVAMYRHIVSEDPGYQKPNQPYYDGYKYIKTYAGRDVVANLTQFLDQDFRAFTQAAEKRNLSDIFLVPASDFTKNLQRIQSIRGGKSLEDLDEEPSESAIPEIEIEVIDESSNPEGDAGGAEISHPFDASKIDIRGQTVSLDLLVKRLKRDQINLYPDYQRLPELWEPERMSQLIESLMIRLPLPIFYFDGSNEVWEVVDGLQRLSTLKRFMVDEGDKALRLTGLEYLKEYNGKTFSELPAFLQSRIEETQLMIYTINPGTPEEIKFNIFKRINTGGLMLTPQEIRNALNQGLPAKTVREMADYFEFKQATGGKIPSQRMEDCDFVTRFIGFYHDHQKYQPDLDTWLNRGLSRLKSLKANELDKLKADFKKSMKTMYEIFEDDAFRKRYKASDRKKPLNKALFDTWSVNLAKLNDDQLKNLVRRKAKLKSGFIRLMNEEEFDIAISRSTGDGVSVRRRFEKIANLISATLQD
jgi:Protein of unknown function DUF262